MEFYYDWERSGFNSTPDGGSWLDQDQHWWDDIWTIRSLFDDARLYVEEERKSTEMPGDAKRTW